MSEQLAAIEARLEAIESRLNAMELATLKDYTKWIPRQWPDLTCRVCGIDFATNTHYVCNRHDCPSRITVSCSAIDEIRKAVGGE